MTIALRSAEFRREREPSWRELDLLVTAVERRGHRALSATQLERLPLLYRHALSSLRVARATVLDAGLIQFLDSLAQRAYLCVHGTPGPARSVVTELFAWRFPSLVRRYRWFVAVSAIALLLGAVVGFAMVMTDVDHYDALVPAEVAQGRTPESTADQLRAPLVDDNQTPDELIDFAAKLLAHNARIGLVAFALGFLAGIPVFILVFVNGLMLGAMAALYERQGLSWDLWAWLLPHGVSELAAVVLCGAAGLMLGHSIVFPGRLTRLTSLARRGRDAASIAVGVVLMFLVAAALEGVFRQLVTDVSVRYSVAGGTAALWLAYFVLAGRWKRV